MWAKVASVMYICPSWIENNTEVMILYSQRLNRGSTAHRIKTTINNKIRLGLKRRVSLVLGGDP